MTRINPSPDQHARLLTNNAFRCCVCKRSKIGFNIHHIDGDNSNTVDGNLAVLCVEDHDHHHRPQKYAKASSHMDLGLSEILRLKTSWEAFVAEAKKPNPRVIATLSCYGTEELVHSLQLVLQWPDERIEHQRSFHILDKSPDQLTDAVIEEVASISSTIQLALINAPLPVEHCSCCGSGYSRTMKPAVVARLTDSDWATQSICSIYVNPTQPSISLILVLRDNQLLGGTLHLCGDTHLHFTSDGIDERVVLKPRPSVRAQAAYIVRNFLREWNPAKVFIGTGDPDTPTIIPELNLPSVWELSLSSKSSRQKKPARK